MVYAQTHFCYLNDFCFQQFGEILGKRLFDKAESRLSQLIQEVDDRGNEAIRGHFNNSMLPVIAFYLTLRESDYTEEEALKITDTMMQAARLAGKKKNERLGKMPFSYTWFKTFCKKVMAKQFPVQGWEVEWVKCNGQEVHFNMRRCIYVETTAHYHCPELCPLFCANDEVTMTGYGPCIVFQREKTIAKGDGVCDFHFKHSKRK